MLHKFSAWTHLSNLDQRVTLVRKVKRNWHVFPACKNGLNFSFRGQFETKILIVRHLSPRYGQVILVSGYPALTVVNWSQHRCAICLQYQSSCAPKLARKCEFEHWLPCGADGQAGGVLSCDYQIFWDGYIYLPMLLCRRASRARAPLKKSLQKLSETVHHGGEIPCQIS